MAAFIAANPGLASRFRTTIEFEDYTDEELLKVSDLTKVHLLGELAAHRVGEVLARTQPAARQRPFASLGRHGALP